MLLSRIAVTALVLTLAPVLASTLAACVETPPTPANNVVLTPPPAHPSPDPPPARPIIVEDTGVGSAATTTDAGTGGEARDAGALNNALPF